MTKNPTKICIEVRLDNQLMEVVDISEIKSAINKHSLIVYFLLAYTISWIGWLSLVIVTPTPWSIQWPTLMTIGISGPLLASLIVTSIINGQKGLREFLSRIFAWRVHYSWYLAAFGIPTMIWFLPTAIHIFLGGTPPVLFNKTPYIPSSCMFLQVYDNLPLCVILQFVTIFLFNGVTEEPGWRGIALPKLQERFNAVQSSIIIGIIHACWHLPLYFIPGTTKYFAETEKLLLPFMSFVIVIILSSFIYTWIYNSTESILLPVISHTMWNLSIGLLRPPTPGYPVGYDVILIVVELGLILILISFFGSENMSRRSNIKD
ncbi:MAG: CPBP family intramembrane metalloprotease [Candidatus Heimdallarchaeota archaeon]|nr:MAG: CPBP family intramembrane metalloprotease [Candidatus Heimdallarchaeota archaeon]